MGRLEVQVGLVEILGHSLLWLILTLVTLGLGGFIWPYYAFRFVLERVRWYSSDGTTYRVDVEGGVAAYVGHAVLWFLVIVLTLGLATPLWIYDVYRYVMQHATVRSIPSREA